MPRYFYHFRSEDGRLTKDPEGQVSETFEEVAENAMASAKEVLAEDLLRGKPALSSAAFEIYDENDNLVLLFPFSEAAEKFGAQP